ncbi:MAG: hypothetical protein KFF50_15085, partial [Desulfatitalea sp.]|nr:hypothetical protein [Desulfatitalea sp.]
QSAHRLASFYRYQKICHRVYVKIDPQWPGVRATEARQPERRVKTFMQYFNEQNNNYVKSLPGAGRYQRRAKNITRTGILPAHQR